MSITSVFPLPNQRSLYMSARGDLSTGQMRVRSNKPWTLITWPSHGELSSGAVSLHPSPSTLPISHAFCAHCEYFHPQSVIMCSFHLPSHEKRSLRQAAECRCQGRTDAQNQGLGFSQFLSTLINCFTNFVLSNTHLIISFLCLKGVQGILRIKSQYLNRTPFIIWVSVTPILDLHLL